MIKAVIFDLFETLITEWSGKKLMKADCAALLGVDARAYSAAMEDFALSMYTGGETYIGAVASSCRACGAEPSGAVLEEILKRRIETKSACFAVQYSERDAVLASLRARGIRLGILSNCSSEEVTVLRASYFYPYFDADALSFEVGLKKPEPAIYALMCSRLDAAPENVSLSATEGAASCTARAKPE